jgi:ribosomal-protein-alanine N-acetyltransferase
LSQSVSVYLRLLQKEDVAEVVEIEREAFSPTWVSSPFKRDLSNRRACYLVACIERSENEPEPAQETPIDGEAGQSWISRLAGRLGFGGAPEEPPAAPDCNIAGYVSVWYQGDEAHITEIAVRGFLRGNGIGELLLIGSLRAAREYGSHVMTLEARVSNFIAQRLYEKYSFKSVGIRKGYYSDNREDAVIMTTTPIGTDEYSRMFRDLQDTWEHRWGPISIED